MGSLRLVLRRARHGAGLLLTILLLGATTTAIIAGTLGYSQAAATTAARAAITGAAPTEAGIRVQTRLSQDPDLQDAAARRAIEQAFAPAQVRVSRSLVSEPRPVEGRAERLVVTAGEALTSDAPGFAERVEVTAGTWPTGASEGGPVPGALHAGAADAWGVDVGDTLAVGATEVTVAALWRPVDGQAAMWFGDPLVVSGVAERQAGPLVVDESAMGSFGSTPFTRWTVQPDADSLQPSDMARLAGAATTLQRTLKIPEVDVRGVTVEGDLGPTTATAARNLATARALNVIPVTLLLLVSVLAVVQIARLQSSARTGEVEVLVARGASRAQLMAWAALESVAVTVLATTVGITAAVVVLRTVPAGAQQSDTMVRTGLAAGFAVLAALAVVAALQVRAISDRSVSDRSGRIRQATTLAALLLVPAAAVLSWWQLDRYGSPLVTAEDGSLTTDLLAGAAPALLLAAAAVLAMALLGPGSRAAGVLTRAGRRAGGHLAAAQVARRLVVYAVPVVLTVLAVGSTTLAGWYAATSTGLRQDLATTEQGAAVRAAVQPAPVPPDTLVTLPDVSGVSHTARAPVWLADTRLGPTEARLTALPADRLAEVTTVPGPLLDEAALAEALSDGAAPAGPEGQGGEGAAEAAVPLPDGPRTLSVEVTMTARADPAHVASVQQATEEEERRIRDDPEVVAGPGTDLSGDEVEMVIEALWQSAAHPEAPAPEFQPRLHVLDPHTVGPQALTLEPVAFEVPWQVVDRRIVAGESTVTAASRVQLPEGAGRSLRGLTLVLGQGAAPYQLDARIQIVDEATGASVLRTGAPLSWQAPAGASGQGGSFGGAGAELEVSHDPRAGVLTVQGTRGAQGETVAVPIDAAPDAEQPVPVAVTSALAGENALAVGDEAAVQVVGATVPVRVAAVVDAVPGTLAPFALLMDSTALAGHLSATGRQLPPPDELWVATEDAGVTVDQLAAVPGIGEVRGPGSVAVTDAASAVRLVFWVASAGAVLLAVTGMAAVTATLLQVRRPEVAVLRALGMPAAAQARSRAWELAGVIAAAVVLGLAAGWAVAALVVPDLARSTTLPGQVQLHPRMALEVPLWAALLGLLLVAVALVITVVAVRVRGQALDNDYREEIR